nr:hypothetical protein K-LCC10_0474 [Kaumoebavirus]
MSNTVDFTRKGAIFVSTDTKRERTWKTRLEYFTCNVCFTKTYVWPWCQGCAKIVGGLEVKPSTIEGAGLGLFAMRDFDEDDVVCQYGSRGWFPAKGLARVYGPTSNYVYLYETGRGHRIDTAVKRTIASFINDNFDKGKINCEFREYEDRKSSEVFIEACAPIKKGDELFVDYGEGYWMHSDKNLHTEIRFEELAGED